MFDLSPLLGLVASLVAVVVGLTAVALLFVVGVEDLRALRREWRTRFVDRWPAAVVLLAVVAVKDVLHGASQEVSWLVGVNITGFVYGLEGNVVATVQSVVSPPLTAYFGFVYLYGFSFLLIFPFVAYGVSEDPRPFRETVAAFSVNYGFGLVAYTLFIAYGPRNYVPGLVEGVLYQQWPSAYLLTSNVSVNTNVFPSLHTSFSVTVALLAWRTRAEYPRWTYLASVLAGSVVLATMYLGIHWATDVVVGTALAVGSVAVARRDPLTATDDWLRERWRRLRAGVRHRLNAT